MIIICASVIRQYNLILVKCGGWEGNRRSGVAVAMRRWLVIYPPGCSRHKERRWAPAYTPVGVWLTISFPVVCASSGASRLTSCRLACQWRNLQRPTRHSNWTSSDNLLAGIHRHAATSSIVHWHCLSCLYVRLSQNDWLDFRHLINHTFEFSRKQNKLIKTQFIS